MAAGGTYHSLVVANGELWSFGDGSYGQLGHDDNANQKLPKKVEALSKHRIEMIAAGGFHSLVVADGELFTFGKGDFGQLGHGSFSHQALPKKVEAMRSKRIEDITAGDEYSLVLAGGELFSFGANDFGQLGHGDSQDSAVPKKVEWFSGKHIMLMSAGGFHSLVLADDELFSFGNSLYGELGHGDEQEQKLPKKIDRFMKKRIEMIAAGGNHSLVVADGELWSFGNGQSCKAALE